MDDGLDADSAALAATMGFTSFGSQSHPSKKRRFNPRADAAVSTSTDTATPSSSILGPAPASLPAKPPVTAANSLPLHRRGGLRGHGAQGPPATRVPAEAMNADEIDLGLHAEDEEGRDSIGGGDEAPVWANPDLDKDSVKDDNEDDPGPQYIDTSRPSVPPLGSFSAQGNHPAGLHGDGSHGLSGRGGWSGRGRGGHGGGGRGGHPGGRAWSVGYYDPSSNQNPWEALETALGLKPMGTWLPRRGGRPR